MRDDAAAFGWASPDVKHNSAAIREKVQNHIIVLNFQYSDNRAYFEAGISYLNKLGEFAGPNTLKVTDKKGKVAQIVGGALRRRRGLAGLATDIPGGEHRDRLGRHLFIGEDLGRVFHVSARATSTLICAGFVNGLGAPRKTAMVRGLAEGLRPRMRRQDPEAFGGARGAAPDRRHAHQNREERGCPDGARLRWLESTSTTRVLVATWPQVPTRTRIRIRYGAGRGQGCCAKRQAQGRRRAAAPRCRTSTLLGMCWTAGRS